MMWGYDAPDPEVIDVSDAPPRDPDLGKSLGRAPPWLRCPKGEDLPGRACGALVGL